MEREDVTWDTSDDLAMTVVTLDWQLGRLAARVDEARRWLRCYAASRGITL